MTDSNLVTTYNLHGQDFLVKMGVANNFLELLLTDKQTGEEWQCSYDSSYIENLTHKTGNFKQFKVFVAMLKSGLLKTSSSVLLDLLSYEDLESLRIRRLKSSSTTKSLGCNKNNRRYLILTYTVEFDRIHYPLPLEYCGPPDPIVLQTTIRKLEAELSDTKQQLIANNQKQDSRIVLNLQSKIEELELENLELREEVKYLKHRNVPNHNLQHLQRAIHNLEKSVVSERKSHHQLVEKLRKEKASLFKDIDRLKSAEKHLKIKLQQALNENIYLRNNCRKSDDTVKTMYRRTSPSYKTTTNTTMYDQKRPRSMSPKITKSDGWERKSGKSAEMRPLGHKHHSRASSQGSLKLSDLEELAFERPSEGKSPRIPKRSSRMKQPRSRTSSASSNGSLASARSRKSDSASLHLMLKTSELEFKTLEERIQGLHTLLKTNF